MFNRYFVSILSVAFLVLVGSNAVNVKPYIYCKGEVTDAKENNSVIALKVIVEPGSALVQEGKAFVSVCGYGDLPSINSDQLMVLPPLVPGKSAVVFQSFREESLEITRWTKKDAFEAVFTSPEKVAGAPEGSSIKVSCKVSTSFPKDICSAKIRF